MKIIIVDTNIIFSAILNAQATIATTQGRDGDAFDRLRQQQIPQGIQPHFDVFVFGRIAPVHFGWEIDDEFLAAL